MAKAGLKVYPRVATPYRRLPPLSRLRGTVSVFLVAVIQSCASLISSSQRSHFHPAPLRGKPIVYVGSPVGSHPQWLSHRPASLDSPLADRSNTMSFVRRVISNHTRAPASQIWRLRTAVVLSWSSRADLRAKSWAFCPSWTGELFIRTCKNIDRYALLTIQRVFR